MEWLAVKYNQFNYIMTSPISLLRASVRFALGSQGARAGHRETQKQISHRAEGVAQFLSLSEAEETAPDDAPIFLLSAGWRSGSTLLQRLLSSGDDVLIWGEAYDRSTIVQHMVDSLAPFTTEWPPKVYMDPPKAIEDVSKVWVANLYPPPQALLTAYRTTIEELFARPAYDLGAKRWGFKEVRFGLAEARLLQGLFPRARFLFIYRDLEETYLSYSRFSPAMDWYARWPEQPAFTPYAYARQWADLRRQMDQAAEDTGGILIAYADLVGGRVDLDRIGDYVGFALDKSVLENRIGSGADKQRAKSVSGLERLLLNAGRRAGERRGGS